ncbi:unnamed protein product [Dracunculus medinensis]|uniref:Wiskott-Aldrich syndrome protein family member n=1 Tax=Dracunculus medinensis TaxID=318479 RepID=A0A0N4U8I9_DRAME|nr:unnamed protein product [Dracunculus medinensis]
MKTFTIVSLEDLHLRKPFKSNYVIDQHTLDRQTLPSALSDCYNLCDPPPNLDALNPYRDDKKSALRYYTDPSYFFDLWRQEMLKDVGDGRRQRAIRSQTENKSPSRKKRNKQSTSNEHLIKTSSRYVIASQQRCLDIMNFPAEYQAPNIVSNDQMYIPVGMSVPVSMNAHSEMNITSRNGEVRTCSTIVTSTNSHLVTQDDATAENSPNAVSSQMAGLNLQDVPMLDDDDDLPPPPPPLMHTSLVCQMPNPPLMQFVAPSENRVAVPPSPPLPPPAPPAPVITVVHSFANTNGEEVKTKTEKPIQAPDSHLNLLAEIQSGIKLKQVQRKEQAAEEKAAAEANDVAAILRRRMEHVLGNSDTETESPSDDDEWD